MPSSGFRFPGGDQRSTVIGATGSGKSVNGVWLLAHQRFDARPWVILDFKGEELFEMIGAPPIERIGYGKPPKKKGLYLLSPIAGEQNQLSDWLWQVFRRGNCGLYIDEAALMPKSDAYVAILQQGRARHIPVIQCCQRPVEVPRQVFSEASFFCVYRIQDRRDARIVEGFVPADLSEPRREHHWLWYDVNRNTALEMGPVPAPASVAQQIKDKLPYTWRPAREFFRPALKRA